MTESQPAFLLQADLVRIWQHQPMTVHSLPKQQSASGSGSPHERAAPCRGYISPLVLSKVQSYLDTAASPSGIRATAGIIGMSQGLSSETYGDK